jgi:hypothetical protein
MKRPQSTGLLTTKYLFDGLTSEEANELEERFKGDPEARREFNELKELDDMLWDLAKSMKARGERPEGRLTT